MTIDGVPKVILTQVAERLGLRLGFDGGEILLHPKPQSRRWLVTRHGYRNGDRYACIHGQAAFIEAVLRRNPEAVVSTVFAVYDGIDDFVERQPTVWKKVVSVCGRERCTCEESS